MWQVYAVLSAVFAALVAVLAKAGLRGVDSDLATAVRTTVVLVLAWGIVAAKGATGGAWALPGRAVLLLTLSGIATGLSWLCYFKALSLGEASRVAPVDKLSVILTMILAVVVLKEELTREKVIGGLLIAAGVLVLLRPARRPEPAAAVASAPSEPAPEAAFESTPAPPSR